ncbi:MAG: FlgD immunoglobulin-like domain containing protein [bacterium]
MIKSNASVQHSSVKRGTDGRLIAAFQDGAGGDLAWTTRDVDSGAWTDVKVDTTTSNGLFTSLAIDSAGESHISYQKTGPSFDLRYARNVGGTWQIEIVDTAGTTGYYSSIATDGDNNPWIAYTGFLSATTFAIKLATKASSAWTITAIDTVTSLDRVSLGIDALGRKHVAYYDAAPGDLMYAVSDAATDVGVAGSVGGAALRLTLVPNPAFEGRTQFSLLHSAPGDARVDLYDTSGRRVRGFTAPQRSSTSLTWQWDGTDDAGRPVAAGVYFLRADAGHERASKKLVVVR